MGEGGTRGPPEADYLPVHTPIQHINACVDLNAETLTLRPTVIAGQRHADDYAVIWRGLPIGRILRGIGA